MGKFIVNDKGIGMQYYFEGEGGVIYIFMYIKYFVKKNYIYI